MTKRIYLGKIVGSHGFKGLFKVKFYNDEYLSLKKFKNNFFIDNIEINLVKKFTKGQLVICKSEKIQSKDELSDIIGKEIWINESCLENNLNEYFHKDLIGSKVYKKKNDFLGKVIAIHNFGAGDVLELDGDYKFMIKFCESNIKDVDVKNKIIKLNKNYE
ncbi:MAG: ribosome maturation factor RimM [Pseudomonadota bacterium]|nr:ribosome maturation factor RimM [Pseudomonadota bacterium]